ncbi:hypothetical protein Tcan_02160 [Toxocara canis]|uniref:Uncharacterized protein n=1 Tax=Toxocara canis TaxID=6265 RepID=A0A0B2UQF5_TOXCA|nr:hypothetical protein Tcan_02160 [Toxocara canis]
MSISNAYEGKDELNTMFMSEGREDLPPWADGGGDGREREEIARGGREEVIRGGREEEIRFFASPTQSAQKGRPYSSQQTPLLESPGYRQSSYGGPSVSQSTAPRYNGPTCSPVAVPPFNGPRPSSKTLIPSPGCK